MRCFSLSPLASATLIVLLGTARAGETIEDRTSRDFSEIEARTKARVGVVAIDSSTARRVQYRPHERFVMCSTFKLLAVAAVLKRVDENRENLDRFVPYGEEQLLAYAPVTRAHVKEGGMMLEALCAAAIEMSDNTAGNLILEAIGGPKALTQFARTLGDDETRLDHMEPALNIVRPGKEDDTTTPAAMSSDVERLFGSEFLSVASRAKLEHWMQRGTTGLAMIRAAVPATWKAGDKTGRSGDGVTNDVAVLRPPSGGPIFIAIYTMDPDETQEARDRMVAEAARTALAALGK